MPNYTRAKVRFIPVVWRPKFELDLEERKSPVPPAVGGEIYFWYSPMADSKP